MIKGIGTDIIEVDRIQRCYDRFGTRFVSRICTFKEQEYCLKHADPAIHLAGRFSAKEAVVKALGTGFQGTVSFHDIEILNDSLGKPIVVFSLRLKEMIGSSNILVSISHCRAYATATAIWVSEINV